MLAYAVFRPKKNIAVQKKKKKAEASTTKKGKVSVKSESSKTNAPPNKILFVTNLPEETTDSMLRIVFQQ